MALALRRRRGLGLSATSTLFRASRPLIAEAAARMAAEARERGSASLTYKPNTGYLMVVGGSTTTMELPSIEGRSPPAEWVLERLVRFLAVSLGVPFFRLIEATNRGRKYRSDGYELEAWVDDSGVLHVDLRHA